MLLVIGFCLMQQILLEIPLLGYVFAPERTQDTVTRFKDWMARKGRTAAVIGAAVIGILLVGRGVITLLQSVKTPQVARRVVVAAGSVDEPEPFAAGVCGCSPGAGAKLLSRAIVVM